MKIALFGGAFDPFHIGHRKIIEAALASGKVSAVIVLPTGLPPHKSRRLSMAAYRYAMTKAGCEGLENVTVSRYELKRPGIYSYTSETVKAFKEILRDKGVKKVKISLIYGSDALDTFESWHEPGEILAEARLLIALRGDDIEKKAYYEERARFLEQKYGGKIRFFDMYPIELSSTLLREKLEKDMLEEEFYPEKVSRFLAKNKPYFSYPVMQEFSDDFYRKLAVLEQKIWDMMPEHRLIHSLNVMHFAVHLAKLHEVSPEKAALAGLLHDVCKYFPEKEQFSLAKKAGPINGLNKSIAHGPAASFYLYKNMGIRDREVLTAISYHTTAARHMSKLDKILYLSDKIEWGRPFKDLDAIRSSAEKDLDAAMRLCLSECRDALKRQGKKLHPLTRACAEEIGLPL